MFAPTLLLILAAWLPADERFAVAAPAPEGLDRAAAAADVRRFLTELIAIDTVNAQTPDPARTLPNGNELATARWFERQLAAAFGPGDQRHEFEVTAADGTVWHQASRLWPGRFEIHVLESAPGRANLIARLRSDDPIGPPVLVMGHMDVVGADPAAWSTPPLQATLVDGKLQGRGAIDCKGPLAAELVAVLALAARREQLARDVVLLATAAEEGGPSVGIDWVLEHRPDLLGDPAFALNEGGRIRLGPDGVESVNIQTTEKVSYNLRVTATGPSGHGSVPLPDNALAALARAVARLHAWRAPASLNDTTRAYFRRRAELEDDPNLAAAMATLVDPASEAAAVAAAVDTLDEVPAYNAVLRAGLSLTLIDGGFRTNVIPSSGSATFNLRVLPDDDVMALVAALQVAAGEPAVTVELSRAPRKAPPPSPLDTPLYRAMESAALTMAPDVAVIPFLSTGATDGAALRARGIPTYGILPIPLDMQDELRMHGDDERAPVEGLGWAAEYIYRVLAAVTDREG